MPRWSNQFRTAQLVATAKTYPQGYHKGNTTGLDGVDADLATGNIKSGITLFGVAGSASVLDVSDANAAVGDVKDPKTFYSVTGPRKTGTMPTVAITAANDNYPAGYHAGNVGGLDAIDANLASANIKSGVTIFGKAGAATVQEIGAADAAVTDVKNPRTFFSVTGGIKTGTMATVALSAAANSYPAGYHAGAASLTAVDGDLVTGSIKSGVTIFGVAGAATVQNISAADAAVANVLSPKTFFSVTGGIKTGTMPTVALSAAANSYPAGYHVGAASLTAVDADLAAGNIKSGITIFGVLGTLESTLAEDIVGTAWSAVVANFATANSRINQSIASGADFDIATKTQSYSATSRAVASGFVIALDNTYGGGAVKLRLYMDGVQVAETDYVGGGPTRIQVIGTKALSGNVICKISLHNYEAGAVSCGIYSVQGTGNLIEAGIAIGSIKI